MESHPESVEDRSDLAARYGTHRPVRRLVGLVLVVVLAGAGLGWLAWVAWFHSDTPVSAGIQGYEVTSAHRVEATVQIQVNDRSVRGECVLQATAGDHAVVGERTFDVTRAGTRTITVRTEREATTVEVARCAERR